MMTYLFSLYIYTQSLMQHRVWRHNYKTTKEIFPAVHCRSTHKTTAALRMKSHFTNIDTSPVLTKSLSADSDRSPVK